MYRTDFSLIKNIKNLNTISSYQTGKLLGFICYKHIDFSDMKQDRLVLEIREKSTNNQIYAEVAIISRITNMDFIISELSKKTAKFNSVLEQFGFQVYYRTKIEYSVYKYLSKLKEGDLKFIDENMDYYINCLESFYIFNDSTTSHYYDSLYVEKKNVSLFLTVLDFLYEKYVVNEDVFRHSHKYDNDHIIDTITRYDKLLWDFKLGVIEKEPLLVF